MTDLLPSPRSPASEAGSLAREMAKAYIEQVTFYHDQLQMTLSEADKRTREFTVFDENRVQDAPADQISWSALGCLMENDPERGQAIWDGIKAEARHELDSGHRAARVLDEIHTSPWERAQYLAVRASFVEEWQPRGGIEMALIDSMAQAYSSYLFWMERLQLTASTEAQRNDHQLKMNGKWEPPRVEPTEWIEQAAAMADRFHRLFLRTLRALRDLRRYAPTSVVVQGVAQVNVANGPQQINVQP